MKKTCYSVLLNKEQYDANKDDIEGFVAMENRYFVIVQKWMNGFEAMKARWQIRKHNRKNPVEYRIQMYKGLRIHQ